MRKSRKRYTGARATSNKVREALFNILTHEIEGARFLDLYAGSGRVGIEALRRGASHVTFVEHNRHAAEDIKARLGKERLSGEVVVVRKKSISYIHDITDKNDQFDIIFLDPPYHTEEILDALSAISKTSVLSAEGTVVAEHFAKKELPGRFDKLIKMRDYHYGDSVLTVFRYAQEPAS